MPANNIRGLTVSDMYPSNVIPSLVYLCIQATELMQQGCNVEVISPHPPVPLVVSNEET